ncbi:MAG TPA: hypothetical protein VGG79_07350 [Roseiarcus sp.]|jgi:hypothetical protein
MHIASALRRKRDEIAASIAVYEARIDAAKMELAALEQAARLFDPESGGDDTALHGEFEKARREEMIPPAQLEVWGSVRPPAMGLLALPVAGANGSASPDVKSIGAQKPQFTGEVGFPVTHRTGEQVPVEFFYLNWP